MRRRRLETPGRLRTVTPPTRSLPPESRPSHRDSGGGAIESALVLPLLLVMVFGVVHMAMYHLGRQAALSAAQVAVAAQQGWGAADDAGQRRAEDYLARIPPVLRDVQPVEVTDDGRFVEATVTGTTVSVIPWHRHTVSQTARGPVERATDP